MQLVCSYLTVYQRKLTSVGPHPSQADVATCVYCYDLQAVTTYCIVAICLHCVVQTYRLHLKTVLCVVLLALELHIYPFNSMSITSWAFPEETGGINQQHN